MIPTPRRARGHPSREALAAPTVRPPPEPIARRPGRPRLRHWIKATRLVPRCPHPGRPARATARNARFKIYEGNATTGELLCTVKVNQAKAPEGISTQASHFQDLGVFQFPLGSTVTVVLSAKSATGTVVADAIGIAPALASGGGPSRYQCEPQFQRRYQATGYRTSPDVSFDASDQSGVTFYLNGALSYRFYGTSLASPCWAGLLAIANQGRVASGGKPFNSAANPQQTLQALYSLPARDFHDITTGYNGLSARSGYDQVTGRGSPIANLLVPALARFGLRSPLSTL